MSVPDKSGSLDAWTQHPARTRLALKTKAKIARWVRSAGTLPRLGFDRVQPDRSVLLGSIVGSNNWRVLRRPVELARLIRSCHFPCADVSPKDPSFV
jgi:hypothetical protein